MESHFDAIKSIYTTQKEHGFLFAHQLEAFSSSEIVDKLIEYAIVEERIDETLILRDIYFEFLTGLLDDYSLDMPEQIAKYHVSLSKLSMKLQTLQSKNEIIKNLEALEKEIMHFESQLKRNIKKLIEETKNIKANNDKLSYAKKMAKASELTSLYLNPLNIILKDHSDSIFYTIKIVIKETHKQKLSNDDNNLRNAYSRVHAVYSQVKKEILNENRILINEVAPLLERIKTESQVLTGFINFLANPSQFTLPKIMDKKAFASAYKKDAYYDARDIWDGYFNTIDDVIISESEALESQWLYDEEKYTTKLLESLPNENYYFWIYNTLKEELEMVDSKSFLQLSKLIIMGQNLDVVYTDERKEIILEDKVFNVPLVHIKGQYENRK